MNTAIEHPPTIMSGFLALQMAKAKKTEKVGYIKKSFDAKPEHAALLDRAKNVGIEIGDVLNAALDRFGADVLRDLLATKSRTIEEIEAQLSEGKPRKHGKGQGTHS